MSSKTLPFPWYGGKYTHLSFIVDNLPQTERYIEPFGGSAVVLINKEPSPIETYNDIDGEVVNFFRVLQTDEEEFIRRLRYTPHSRGFYDEICESEPKDDIDRALFFLVRTAQSFGGIKGGGWGSSIGTSRRGKPQRTQAWQTRVENVEETAERLMDVQIECLPATELIERHDHEDATFYCDPPYPPSARGSTGQYRYEMGEDEHRDLASVVRNVDGFVAVSGYLCELMDELYDGWYVLSEGEKRLAGEGDLTREEVLYTNYDPSIVAE